MNHNFNEVTVANLTLDEKVHYGIIDAAVVEEIQSTALDSQRELHVDELDTAQSEIDKAIRLLEESNDAESYETERGMVERALEVLRGIYLDY